jgi:hypothetical protein
MEPRRGIRHHWKCAIACAAGLSFAALACERNPAGDDCRDVEALAYADTVAILDSVRVGEDLPVRVVGLVDLCSALRRIELETRADTFLLRPISGFRDCPGLVCPAGMKWFVDTVRVPTVRPGPHWVRVLRPDHRRLVDSTLVRPAPGRGR